MLILAIDLGKFKSVGCVFDADTQEHKFVHTATRPEDMHNLLTRIGPCRVVIEIGPSAGWFSDLASALDIEVQVANVNHEAWRWRNVKNKTDKLDALKLAQLSAMNQLPMVCVPKAEVRELRALLQYRARLVERRSRIKNTIRSLIHRLGLTMPSGASGWTRASLNRLSEMACPLEKASPSELWRGELYEELLALSQAESRLGVVEAKLESLTASDDRVRRLRTIPCVGACTAQLLVAVIDDPHRFASAKQVGSYAGLTPRQYQSGQMDRHGRISKQGHRQLRRMLVEVSWLALRYNEPLRRFYERICGGHRSRRKKAIVAVARKLLTWAWAILRDESCWRASPAVA